jgi:hypothetical protein
MSFVPCYIITSHNLTRVPGVSTCILTCHFCLELDCLRPRTMLIDVSVSSSSAFNPKLPSCIAKLDNDELVLIELQGTLDVECGEDATRDGQFIGKLNLKDAVC